MLRLLLHKLRNLWWGDDFCPDRECGWLGLGCQCGAGNDHWSKQTFANWFTPREQWRQVRDTECEAGGQVIWFAICDIRKQRFGCWLICQADLAQGWTQLLFHICVQLILKKAWVAEMQRFNQPAFQTIQWCSFAAVVFKQAWLSKMLQEIPLAFPWHLQDQLTFPVFWWAVQSCLQQNWPINENHLNEPGQWSGQCSDLVSCDQNEPS